MSDEHHSTKLATRVRKLADYFVGTDLLRLRITREHEEIELGRRSLHPDLVPDVPEDLSAIEAAPANLESIKADLVGIFHLSRPASNEGDLLEGDRELAFIEALGIRNPVRSHGAGRIVAINQADGDPVEYGAVLFEIDRG
jgi:biotin carboxyl carrier protein